MPPRSRTRHAAMPQPERAAVSASLDAFRRILRELRVAARRTQVTAGISAAQLYVLRSLEDGSEASVSAIAARTMTDRSSVAAVVERLTDAGLVVREPSRDDRRRASITITSAGRAVLSRAPAPPTALLVEGLEALSARELASLARGLTTLTEAMGVSEQPAGMLFEEGDEPAGRATARSRRR